MSHPRDGLRQPFEGYPAYGAVHDVRPNEQLRSFMFDFARNADGIFVQDTSYRIVDTNNDDLSPEERTATINIIDVDGNPASAYAPDYDPRKYYRVFDPETLGVSVVEMEGSKRAAQAARAVWQKNDLGAVEKEAKNVIGRQLPNLTPRLLFTHVTGVGGRLPNAPQADVKKKLALMPDSTKFPETFDLIDKEAAIIIEAIRRRLKQFEYPWDLIPHLTYAVFRGEARSEQIIQVQERAEEYVQKHSFGVQLGTLSFRHKLRR